MTGLQHICVFRTFGSFGVSLLPLHSPGGGDRPACFGSIGPHNPERRTASLTHNRSWLVACVLLSALKTASCPSDWHVKTTLSDNLHRRGFFFFFWKTNWAHITYFMQNLTHHGRCTVLLSFCTHACWIYSSGGLYFIRSTLYRCIY